LKVVLKRLESAGLTINQRKCKFAALEADYLGYRITREGVMPQMSKIQSISKLQPPTNKK
jgi:hypothetical protein